MIDKPVTDQELNSFYGFEEEAMSQQAMIALAAIRAIPAPQFTRQEAAALAAALSCKVATSGFAHMQHGAVDVPTAIEELDDAHFHLGEGA